MAADKPVASGEQAVNYRVRVSVTSDYWADVEADKIEDAISIAYGKFRSGSCEYELDVIRVEDHNEIIIYDEGDLASHALRNSMMPVGIKW